MANMALGARLISPRILDHIEELKGDDDLKALIIDAFEKYLDEKGYVACGNITSDGAFNFSSGRAATATHLGVILPVIALAIGEQLADLKGKITPGNHEQDVLERSQKSLIESQRAEIESLRRRLSGGKNGQNN